MPSTGIGGKSKEDSKPSVENEIQISESQGKAGSLTIDRPEKPKPKPALKIREHWGQEKGQIVLTMYQKKLVKKNVRVECTTDTISILLSLPDGSQYARNIRLADQIKPNGLR